MMAEFDSGSESETHATKISRPISKLDFTSKITSTAETRQPNHLADSDVDSEDADEIVRPKGRMAARMQGNANASPKEDTAFSRLSNALRKEQEQAKKSPTSAESSEDDLPAPAPKRKNKGKARQSPAPSDQSRRSPSRARTASPLFVSSPAPPRNEFTNEEDANEETNRNPKYNARFLALVAQKRKEREERERIEAEQKAAKRASMERFSSEIVSGEDSEADDLGSAKKLSQNARQPRKASKKALEEMSRETQRMSRNMQLAHQAQTKKKITKESLFARFNFMQPDVPAAEAPVPNSSSTAGSQQSSDGEAAQKKNDTPHTSPILGPSDADKPMTGVSVSNQPDIDADNKAAEGATITSTESFVEAKNAPKEPKEPFVAVNLASTEVNLDATKPKRESRKMTKPSVRVLMSRHDVAQHNNDESDSDDLEVVTSPAKARRIAAFENLPTRKMQESSSMTKLKALAHLTSPTRKSTSMTSAELSAGLLYRARQQAAKERRERIDELRAKGVIIETAEERAAMEDDVENLVEKARQEADEIARQERAARKKAQGLDEDDEDDDDFEFSGSDDNGSGEDEDEDDVKSASGKLEFLDREVDEDEDSADEQSEIGHSEVEDEVPGSRRKRRTLVVSDDEEDEEPQVPSTPVRPPSHAAQSAERPQFPGMQTPNMSMGLTQAFAGTLADEDDTSQRDSAPAPFSLPDPDRPIPRLQAESSEILVRDSQEQCNENDFMQNYNQNIARVSESPANHRFSQYSQLPDPTQDEGFVFSPFDPAKRFKGTPPVSTVDTVIVGQSQSPIAERKRKQLRRGRAADLSIVEEEDNEGDFEINADAFNVMKKANKKPTVIFDKKNSKAKGIVDEAAEESEDEYAGIGGASDDSDGEEDAYDQQMINDQSGEVVDEKQLAALNAYVEVCPNLKIAY
jgi:mediator of replication checkpoint protein 1